MGTVLFISKKRERVYHLDFGEHREERYEEMHICGDDYNKNLYNSQSTTLYDNNSSFSSEYPQN